MELIIKTGEIICQTGGNTISWSVTHQKLMLQMEDWKYSQIFRAYRVLQRFTACSKPTQPRACSIPGHSRCCLYGQRIKTSGKQSRLAFQPLQQLLKSLSIHLAEECHEHFVHAERPISNEHSKAEEKAERPIWNEHSKAEEKADFPGWLTVL